MNASPASRLYFLDWIRIFAFIVLIFYHTGMYYVSWDWHVKSPYASDTLEPLMMLSSPWRLGLLFMISGVASAYMMGKLRTASFLGQRSWKLLLPLIFGMLVIVPPQAYFEVVEKVAYKGGYGEFMQLYLGRYHGFCRGQDCLIMPTWNHLWFVAYLWIYTLVLGGLALLAGARLQRWSDKLGALLAGWKIIVLPVAVLAAARIALADSYPANHAVAGDWYNHAQYLFLFLLGVMLARQAGFWQRVEKMRWLALGLSLAGWALIMVFNSIPEALYAATPELHTWRPALRTVYAMCQWTPILAICGFGHRHLNRDSANRRYLTQAVFPVYILHQTLIVTMAHWLKPVQLSPKVEGAVLVILTFAISFGAFEIIRRVALLRPLFGLNLRQPAAEAATTPTSQTPAYVSPVRAEAA
jgi:surface polysaccharide O-acyltransferase-like enzyme